MQTAPANTFVMDDIDPRFNDANYGVAATEFERSTLREQYKDRISWVDDDAPLVCEIGKLGTTSLRYRFDWAVINGCRVLFYACVGEVDAPHRIAAWLRSVGPEAITNAMMFHKVIMTVTDGEGLQS